MEKRRVSVLPDAEHFSRVVSTTEPRSDVRGFELGPFRDESDRARFLVVHELDSERLQPVRRETFRHEEREREDSTTAVIPDAHCVDQVESLRIRAVENVSYCRITSYGEEKRNVKVYLTYFPSFVKKPILKKV